VVYNKINILGLLTFLWEKFSSWASNCRCFEKGWTRKFFLHRILRKKSRLWILKYGSQILNVKVTKHISGEYYSIDLEKYWNGYQTVPISQEKCTTVRFKIYTQKWRNGLDRVLHFVKRRNGKREDICAIKDVNGRLITNSKAKTNSLNFGSSSVFGCERRIWRIQCASSDEAFAFSIKIIKTISSNR
jgi:hypothetical protein